MRVEGRVVNFRKRNSIRDYWLTKLIVFIGNDMCSVEQQRLGKARKSTASIVSCYDGLPECCLMQSLLDRAQRVSPLQAVRRGCQSLWIRSKRYTGAERLSVPAGDEGRKEGLIAAGCYPKKVDEGYLVLVGLFQPSIIGRIRVFAHEGVADCLITLEYLAMDFPLIIIPNFTARLRKYCFNGQ